MKAKDVFHDLLIKRFSPFLRSEGFTRKGHTFAKWVGKNARVIHFQPSKWSNPDYYEFAVNLGTLSARIFRFETEHNPLPKVPDVASCHWRDRLGHLVLEGAYAGKGSWWALDAIAESVEVRDSGHPIVVFPTLASDALADEIVRLIKVYGFPALERYGTDEGLRDSILDGVGIRQSQIVTLWYLSILLLEIGAHSELSKVLAEFRALAREMPVPLYWERRIERIEEKFGSTLKGVA